MKYCTSLFLFVVWRMKQISTSNTKATSNSIAEQILNMSLVEKMDVNIHKKPLLMLTFKGSGVQRILVVSNEYVYVIYSENSTLCINVELKSLRSPKSIVMAPDGAFTAPAATITDFKRISQLDMSVTLKPRLLVLYEEPEKSKQFYSHVWINTREFIVEYGIDGDDKELLCLKFKIVDDTNLWETNKIMNGSFSDMFLYKFAQNSFDIIYARAPEKIFIIWSEDAEGKPGNWQNPNHIKTASIAMGAVFLTSADLNNDGSTELLLSIELQKEISKNIMQWFVEVTAYEIPNLKEFRSPDNYVKHRLFSYPKPSGKELLPCIKHLKTFIPFASYKGKPWILIGEDQCGGASYLQPKSEAVGNWDYQRNQFYTSDGTTLGIEVADINQDGYTELFIATFDATKDQAAIKEFNFFDDKIIAIPPPTSTSSILYLDSTLPILTGLLFLLTLL